jgi:hypothetical protein
MEIGAVVPASLTWLAVIGAAIAGIAAVAHIFETVFDLDLD